jgi:hypothetical protein
MSDPIFVFGSNLAGRHGKGAALFAVMQRGAVPGQGVGRMGNSYGIPTKDEALKPLPLEVIAEFASRFVDYARQHPDDVFELTPIGCGLAGYTPAQIAPMFRGTPDNVLMPWPFTEVLHDE